MPIENIVYIGNLEGKIKQVIAHAWTRPRLADLMGLTNTFALIKVSCLFPREQLRLFNIMVIMKGMYWLANEGVRLALPGGFTTRSSRLFR